MALYRPPPTCPHCNEVIAEGQYRDQSNTPPMLRIIGDTFIGWKYNKHFCKEQQRWIDEIKGSMISLSLEKMFPPEDIKTTIEDNFKRKTGMDLKVTPEEDSNKGGDSVKPMWVEIDTINKTYWIFRLINTDSELVHIIKTGNSDSYLLIPEDTDELNYSMVEFHTKLTLKDKYNITLKNYKI